MIFLQIMGSLTPEYDLKVVPVWWRRWVTAWWDERHQSPSVVAVNLGVQWSGWGLNSWEVCPGKTRESGARSRSLKRHSALHLTFALTSKSLWLSGFGEIDWGLHGGEESTSTGTSSFTFTSDDVCKVMSKAPVFEAGSCTDTMRKLQNESSHQFVHCWFATNVYYTIWRG